MNFGEITEEERWNLIIYKTKNSLTNKITYYDKPINGEYINNEPIILSDSEKKSRDKRNEKEFFLVHYHYFMGEEKNSYYSDYHLNEFCVYEQ